MKLDLQILPAYVQPRTAVAAAAVLPGFTLPEAVAILCFLLPAAVAAAAGTTTVRLLPIHAAAVQTVPVPTTIVVILVMIVLITVHLTVRQSTQAILRHLRRRTAATADITIPPNAAAKNATANMHAAAAAADMSEVQKEPKTLAAAAAARM